MPWRNQSEPTAVEKVVAGLNYLTFGITGLIYTLLGRPGAQNPYFRFHFLQAIVLSILGMLFSQAGIMVLTVFMSILEKTVPADAVNGVGQVAGITISILTNAFWLLLAYGAIMAFLGKYAEVPFISNVVRQNMR